MKEFNKNDQKCLNIDTVNMERIAKEQAKRQLNLTSMTTKTAAKIPITKRLFSKKSFSSLKHPYKNKLELSRKQLQNLSKATLYTLLSCYVSHG